MCDDGEGNEGVSRCQDSRHGWLSVKFFSLLMK